MLSLSLPVALEAAVHEIRNACCLPPLCLLVDFQWLIIAALLWRIFNCLHYIVCFSLTAPSELFGQNCCSWVVVWSASPVTVVLCAGSGALVCTQIAFLGRQRNTKTQRAREQEKERERERESCVCVLGPVPPPHGAGDACSKQTNTERRRRRGEGVGGEGGGEKGWERLRPVLE